MGPYNKHVNALEALWLLTATGKMAYPQLLTSQQATGPASDVSLTVSCRKLAKSDVLSKSDPMAVVYQLAGDGSWAEVLTYVAIFYVQLAVLHITL